jgi:putative PEP-CTERM system TPR-repeat lipoprotein
MAGNDYVAASAELRKVVSANPNFAQARFLLGVALFAQGNLEQAGQELAAVVDLMPENIEARQLLAQVRMRQQDPDAAMRVLVPALQSGAEGSRLSALLDAARSRAGGAQTIELLERALQDSPKNRTLQIQLATAHLQSGQAERALTVLRSIEGNESGVRDEALLLQAIVKANGTAAARAEVDAMVARDPADANVVGLAAAFYAHVGDANAARRLLSEATQRDPQNLSLIFALAQLEISSQRPAEARTALSRVLDIDPQHLPGRLLLAELELASGNTDAAKQALESARKSSPDAPLPRLLLARMALMHDDASQASALIDEALAGAPAPIEIHSAAGLLYLNNGRFDQALAHFDKVTDLDPANVTAWLNLGRAQQALGQHGAARESLMRALKLRRDWLPAEGALAFIDLQSGHRAAALERVARLENAYPRDAAVLTLAGDVYASARDYPEAARAFEEAARIRPSATLAFKVYDVRRVGRLPKPLEPLEQWVAKNSSDVMARSLLAEAYTLAGERKRAVEHYEYVAGAQPRHVVALNNLAWLYFELGDSRAHETARKAYGLAPRSAAIADTLGWILAESGQVQEGLPILKNAVALAPAIPEIRFHYAVALARSGARDQARAELDKVLEDPSEFTGRASAEQLRKQLEATGQAGA